MKYTVEFTMAGGVELDAASPEEAVKIAALAVRQSDGLCIDVKVINTPTKIYVVEVLTTEPICVFNENWEEIHGKFRA